MRESSNTVNMSPVQPEGQAIKSLGMLMQGKSQQDDISGPYRCGPGDRRGGKEQGRNRTVFGW